MNNPDDLLKFNPSYTKVCPVTQTFDLSDLLGQRFDAWYNGRDWLISQNLNVGQSFLRTCRDVKIFYLVLKTYTYTYAEPSDVTLTLQDMFNQANANNITHIAFSKILFPEIPIENFIEEVNSLKGSIQVIFL